MFTDQSPSEIPTTTNEIIEFPDFYQNNKIDQLIKKYAPKDSSTIPSKAKVDELIKKYTIDSPADPSKAKVDKIIEKYTIDPHVAPSKAKVDELIKKYTKDAPTTSSHNTTIFE